MQGTDSRVILKTVCAALTEWRRGNSLDNLMHYSIWIVLVSAFYIINYSFSRKD